MRGQGGQPTRLFSLFRGPHWTLIGHETDRAEVAPRPGLRIHIVGERGDLIDDGGHFRNAYGLAPGEWALVRPDGYVGAIVGADGLAGLERYLAKAGARPARASRAFATPSGRARGDGGRLSSRASASSPGLALFASAPAVV